MYFEEEMYHTIKAGTYRPILKTSASIISLRVGNNCNKGRFRLVIHALGKVDRFLKNGDTLIGRGQVKRTTHKYIYNEILFYF